MPGLPIAPDSPVSSSSSEEGHGPIFGAAPHQLYSDSSDSDIPASPILPGSGIIDDGGAVPAIAQVLPFPEGTDRALAPAVRFYDLEEHRHRLWQADPHPDRPVVEGHTCSFPDFLMYAVERERDDLLASCEEAREDEQVLHQTIDELQTELQTVRTERDEARRAAVDAQIDVARAHYGEVALREEVEFAEGQYREILEERGQMVLRARSQEQIIASLERQVELREQIATVEASRQAEIIAGLERQVQTRDRRLERGMRVMRRSYRMFEDEEYAPEIPFVLSSEASRPKRVRLYEPLEGSSGGPTDPTDDDDSGGATSGGSASTPAAPVIGGDGARGSSGGGPDDTPMPEAVWLVE